MRNSHYVYDGQILQHTVVSYHLTNVAVVSQEDTRHIAEAAVNAIPAKIVANQTVSVDTTTGATLTGFGIINATRAALEEAGALAAFSAKTDPVSKTNGTEETVDIVIVGGGGSGLTAAAYAKKVGAGSVLVLEKMAYTGGSTSISGGGSIVGGSRYNELAGTDYTPEEYQIVFSYHSSCIDKGRGVITPLFICRII